MAVYEGARRTGVRQRSGPLLPGILPGASSVEGLLPRRRVRGSSRAGRRSDRVGIVLGAIVVVFMLTFFWLAQSMRVSATGYEIDRLLLERERLEARQRSVVSDLNRLGREPAIRKLALDMGLGQLSDPIIVLPK